MCERSAHSTVFTHCQHSSKAAQPAEHRRSIQQPTEKGRVVLDSGKVLQILGHVPSKCCVLVLVLKPRQENPILLIIFIIIKHQKADREKCTDLQYT